MLRSPSPMHQAGGGKKEKKKDLVFPKFPLIRLLPLFPPSARPITAVAIFPRAGLGWALFWSLLQTVPRVQRGLLAGGAPSARSKKPCRPRAPFCHPAGKFQFRACKKQKAPLLRTGSDALLCGPILRTLTRKAFSWAPRIAATSVRCCWTDGALTSLPRRRCCCCSCLFNGAASLGCTSERPCWTQIRQMHSCLLLPWPGWPTSSSTGNGSACGAGTAQLGLTQPAGKQRPRFKPTQGFAWFSRLHWAA